MDGQGDHAHGGEELVIAWLCSARGTSNGIMTFAPLGQKAPSRSDGYRIVSTGFLHIRIFYGSIAWSMRGWLCVCVCVCV